MIATKKMLTIGNKVRRARGKRSYYEIAKESEVTQKMIENIESGAHCSVGTLIKVCEAVGLKVEVTKRINNEEGD